MSEYIAKTETDEETGVTIKIISDADIENPYDYRDDDGQIIAVFSRNYINPAEDIILTVGEVTYHLKDVDDAKAFEEAAKGEDFPWFVIPLYAYDHSSIIYRVAQANPFSCKWDSGRAGFIALKRAEWGDGKEGDDKLAEYAGNVADAYTDYCNGNAYGYVVEDGEGEEIDACWGFLGDYDEPGGAYTEGKGVFDQAVLDAKAAKAAAEKQAHVDLAHQLEEARPDLYKHPDAHGHLIL